VPLKAKKDKGFSPVDEDHQLKLRGRKWEIEATMFDSVPLSKAEPISRVSSGWLRAARYSAFICVIALAVGFIAETVTDRNGLVALMSFGPWGSFSLALLYLLFRRGKNSLAFALGMGAATAFIALLVVAAIELSRSGLHLELFRHVLFIVMLSGILPPFDNLMNGLHPQVAILGTLLFWLFSISLAVLGLSSIVSFKKITHEANGLGKLRLAFRAGMCCPFVVWLILMPLFFLFFGGFHM
jgi:hypothetical protein